MRWAMWLLAEEVVAIMGFMLLLLLLLLTVGVAVTVAVIVLTTGRKYVLEGSLSIAASGLGWFINELIMGGHFLAPEPLATGWPAGGGQATAVVRFICELGLGFALAGGGGGAVAIDAVAALGFERAGSITGAEEDGGAAVESGTWTLTAWPQVVECLGQCICWQG